jgi:hypothetical protein
MLTPAEDFPMASEGFSADTNLDQAAHYSHRHVLTWGHVRGLCNFGNTVD